MYTDKHVGFPLKWLNSLIFELQVNSTTGALVEKLFINLVKLNDLC